MDVGRSEKIAEIVKNISGLGKNIKKPVTPGIMPTILSSVKKLGNSQENLLPAPTAGSGFVRILMYIIAGVLAICLLLLAVDQWITPIFQRKPGGEGYILIPGTDISQVYWLTNQSVSDILVGSPPSNNTLAPQGSVAASQILSTQVIEGQSNYSITMDIYISNEFPQNIGADNHQRIFFILGNSIDSPSLRVSIDNAKNTAYITAFDSEGLQESVQIDNVPIHKSFRIGISKSPYIMEGYLNGLLVQTRRLRSTTKVPSLGDKVFAPANIRGENGSSLSQGIKVLNLRIFGYTVEPSEMQGRMGDLVLESTYTN